MNYKGLISSIDTAANSAEVIIPERDNIVTAPLRFLEAGSAASSSIGQFVVVLSFSDDINDSVIIIR